MIIENKEYVKKWYIIHTYSGYEKKVKTDLEKRIMSEDLTDKVFRILVPEEKVFEEKKGKMVPVFRKIFPSYVLVEMLAFRDVTEDSVSYRVDSRAWYIIRNTNGVTGFVGVGSDPLPMDEKEVEDIFSKMSNEDFQERSNYEVGDYVKTLDGIEGTVEHIDYIAKQVKIVIQVGSRPTTLTLGLNEVTKF
ncbi:transcription termination/antitermination NusG family protein [Streptobacillus notomytis]|uniref:transcription termination/antitermination NusG family protein n=1 Tax=Streptobacillus notomytis TaxID=1712031 RepID=UPI00082FAB28|nr:transcription termination/antitermination NusG family protein [Streptobacillus notomytis]